MYMYVSHIFPQKFENRALVVSQTEEPRWKELSIDFMSEESDDESDILAVVVHRPKWRSKRMCNKTVIHHYRFIFLVSCA